MKILVIGGMHGNEPLGIEVVKLFSESPVPNIDVVIANKDAVKAGVRFTNNDLSRSFSDLETRVSKSYEEARARELLETAAGYDVVLDFHNTHCPENDCGFVGAKAPQKLYDAAWLLGLRRVVVADYDCINKYALNCLSVEVSLDSTQNNPVVWYEKISLLSRLEIISTKEKLERYRFVHRLTLEERDRYKLENQSLNAFQMIDKRLSDKLSLPSESYPIFIADKYTPYNYGGVLVRLNSGP